MYADTTDVYVFKITNGKVSKTQTSELSGTFNNLVATTISDTNTGIQYAIFGGGYVNGDSSMPNKTVNAFSFWSAAVT